MMECLHTDGSVSGKKWVKVRYIANKKLAKTGQNDEF